MSDVLNQGRPRPWGWVLGVVIVGGAFLFLKAVR